MDAAVAVVVHGAVHVLQPLAHVARARRGDFPGASDKISVRDCGFGELRAPAVHVQKLQTGDARVQHPEAVEVNVDEKLAPHPKAPVVPAQEVPEGRRFAERVAGGTTHSREVVRDLEAVALRRVGDVALHARQRCIYRKLLRVLLRRGLARDAVGLLELAVPKPVVRRRRGHVAVDVIIGIHDPVARRRLVHQ